MYLNGTFRCLLDSDLIFKVKKGRFFQRQVKFLGHSIIPDDIQPDTDKVQMIANFPLTMTIEDLRRYLGMVNL